MPLICYHQKLDFDVRVHELAQYEGDSTETVVHVRCEQCQTKWEAKVHTRSVENVLRRVGILPGIVEVSSPRSSDPVPTQSYKVSPPEPRQSSTE